jgi:intracellular multiplication protein IcmJ
MSKALLPLFLSVKATNWRMNDKGAQEADLEFQRSRKKALERDNHTCRFCGFRNNKWQEVHHFNDDHHDNRLENLVTACSFCHMCQHIGLAGAHREAILIYRPELTQAQIHHLVRTALVADAIHEGMKAEVDQAGQPKRGPNLKLTAEAAEMGKNLLASLKSSADGARQHILTSDPVDLANAMLLMPDEAYARRKDFLAGIRLLPLGVRSRGNDNIMTQMVDSWRAGGTYTNLMPNTWKTLITQFS